MANYGKGIRPGKAIPGTFGLLYEDPNSDWPTFSRSKSKGKKSTKSGMSVSDGKAKAATTKGASGSKSATKSAPKPAKKPAKRPVGKAQEVKELPATPLKSASKKSNSGGNSKAKTETKAATKKNETPKKAAGKKSSKKSFWDQVKSGPSKADVKRIENKWSRRD